MSAERQDPADRWLYGLRLRSEIPLPELAEAVGEGTPDVLIRRGEIAGPISANGQMEAFEGGASFAIPGVARYAMVGGREIVVDPEPGAAERNVRLYLLGSAMGMIVHQRGLLPLHANAVEVEGKAFAFMGRSGTGKSTLAAWFAGQGKRVLADDVCVVGWNERSEAVAFPGLQRLRLWREAMEHFGHDPRDHQRSYSGDDEYDKYDVPTAERERAVRPVPLAGLYLLDRGEGFDVEPLAGTPAAEALIANTYRGKYLALTESRVAHWQACMRLVRRVPIFRAQRSWDLARIDAENAEILTHAVGSIGGSARDR